MVNCPPTRVLFLDFDGPMVPMNASWSSRDCIGEEYTPFDPAAVEAVLRVLTEAHTKLVISSSWRNIGYERMADLLEREGINKSHLHDDWSIDFSYDVGMGERARFIQAWLDRHPEIDHYGIVDDLPMDIPNLIKVSTFDGMSKENRLNLFKLFNLNN